MKEEKLKVLQEKTRGVFHILEYRRFWDYITNLQTIEQQYSAILSENAELENKITNLQEENEKVHKELDYADNYNIYLISRIDKAIEYINKLSNEPNVFGHYGIDGNCKKYLLNILQGEDKE